MARFCNTLALSTLLAVRAAAINGTFPPAPDDLELKNYTALTEPLPLAIGEVSNANHKIKIPPGPIAVYGFKADIVEIDPESEEIIPVPLNEAYLHHLLVGSPKRNKNKDSKRMYKPVTFSAGSESRGAPVNFYYPFAFTTPPDEDAWNANVHIINTRQMATEEAHRCLECPCTSEDVDANGTIKDSLLGWDNCNDLLATVLDNDSCHMETYKGGLRCCEHGEYCLEKSALPKDSTVSTFYLRYTLTYAELRPTNRPLGMTGFDVTSDFLGKVGNMEYDVPQCKDPVNNAEDCVYEVTVTQAIQPGKYALTGGGQENSNKYLDVVYILGHLHRGGIEVELKDAQTDEVICLSKASYGKDFGVVGGEKDYLVAMSSCTFYPPRRMSVTDLLTVTARYNSTEAHTGVMGMFYIAAAEPIDDNHEIDHDHDDHHDKDAPMVVVTIAEEENHEAMMAAADNADASTSSFSLLFVTCSLIVIFLGAAKKISKGSTFFSRRS